MENCIFCKIAAGEIPSTKVYEDERVLAFRDIDPQAPVHVLLIPKKHFADILECDSETFAYMQMFRNRIQEYRQNAIPKHLRICRRL